MSNAYIAWKCLGIRISYAVFNFMFVQIKKFLKLLSHDVHHDYQWKYEIKIFVYIC